MGLFSVQKSYPLLRGKEPLLEVNLNKFEANKFACLGNGSELHSKFSQLALESVTGFLGGR